MKQEDSLNASHLPSGGVNNLNKGLITSFKPSNELEVITNLAWRLEEEKAVAALIDAAQQASETEQKVQKLATQLAINLRERKSSRGKEGLVQGLLQEFSLSSNEGIALMCLAEALLRIPDKKTRDLLIQDKINQGNWQEHVGHSPKMFVNAATWGLIITDKLIASPCEDSLLCSVTNLIGKFGRPVIRKSVDVAMRIMGEQFVTGETIQEALKNSQRLQAQGFTYSYDMLGEAALTAEDAERYYQDYLNAIHVIGQSAKGAGVYKSAGISIKLSALHPRYQRAQIERVHAQLYPKLLSLVDLAKQYDIGINIDAEESERLELSLGLLEKLCFESSLANWNGIGFVIQGYQKRCYYLIDYLIDLARRSQHRLMIRLVKGAYWDSEIKKAQVDGMSDYPVFTRKVHTDLSYLACAKKLLVAKQEIFPQFATHNAQTLAAIYHMAQPETYHPEQYEFQCLHGMGEPLYEQVVGRREEGKLGVPCRIYAPVGNHETLLAYLVRRLLENGANSSFVNRIADKSIPIEDIVRSPFAEIEEIAKADGVLGQAHPLIRLPKNLYGSERKNSDGYDLHNDTALRNLQMSLAQLKNKQWHAEPSTSNLNYSTIDVDVDLYEDSMGLHLIKNPANHQDIVGTVREASLADVDMALSRAQEAQSSWAKSPMIERASALLQAADLIEAQIESFMVLLARESGKTYANAVAEVREAVDFLRYYSAQAKSLAQSEQQKLEPLGTVLCISPWNFPLAIFLGQISAALVTGNVVIAKPAEQTPLVAMKAVKLLWQAGISSDVLQILPGQGETVGAALSQDARIDGIMFTGSTEVAKILQKTLAQRLSSDGQPIPLVAETGGQNALLVDSSALSEQVVQDVIVSAFDSAGQRCSALRLLCVQEDCYQSLVQMLKGAAQELIVGNTLSLSSDIGPVIDQESKNNLLAHIEKMKARGYSVQQYCLNMNDKVQDDLNSTFVLPSIIELDSLEALEREVFGPVLHIIKYKYGELESLLETINSKGYGLTMGLHTRIDGTIQQVIGKARVGNLYINRNIVGAVVGVQPFGGQGLSGTGPKAGGPLYLHRLVKKPSKQALTRLYGVVAGLLAEPENQQVVDHSAEMDFNKWLKTQDFIVNLDTIKEIMCLNKGYSLPGPTGEANTYYLLPRSDVAAIADDIDDQIRQIHTLLGMGCRVELLSNSPFAQQLYAHLPETLKSRFTLFDDLSQFSCDAILHHGKQEALLNLQQESANKLLTIVPIIHMEPGDTDIPIVKLVHERAVSINTTAAGGNTSLMMMDA